MSELTMTIQQDPRYESIRNAREGHASNARKAQARFRLLNRTFIVATALAAVFGGLVLYGIGPTPAPLVDGAAEIPLSDQLKQFVSTPWVRIVLGIGQAITLGLATFCGYLLNKGNYVGEWLANRVKAEQGRVALVKAALVIGHEKGSDAFRGAGQNLTEFVDAQLSHLKDAVGRHDRRAFYLLIFGGIVAAVAVIASSVAATGIGSLVLLAAFIGVLTPALIAALKSWGESTADQERAKLHQTTWEGLNALNGNQGDFRAAIERNDLPAALEYADKVFAVLRTDVSEFAKLVQPAGPSTGAGTSQPAAPPPP